MKKRCLTAMWVNPASSDRGPYPSTPRRLNSEALQTEKAARISPCGLRLSPGSYLLSRDLSSDYHRRADVSLPGSEWDRVGPSGYDHQASVCCVSCFLLQPLARVVILFASGLCFLLFLLAVFSACGFAFSRLTSAWLVGLFRFYAFCSHSRSSSVFIKGLSPKV